MIVSNKFSYVLTQTIRFLSMCELLLLNIKKLIRFNKMYINANKLEPKFPNLFNTEKS